MAGRSFALTVAACVCKRCGAVLISSGSLERATFEVACDLALRGPLAGESFRFVRKALGLSAVALAGLLDVTPETISRWENGQRMVDRCAWLTLGTLMLERAGRSTKTMDRIAALREQSSHARERAPVKIDASRISGIRRKPVKRDVPGTPSRATR